MGVIIEIKNIVSPNNFKLFYKEGRTPGSVSEQESPTWGTQYGEIYMGGTTSINVEVDNPYGKQYWFKMLDIVTNSYIIENIYIHELDFYTKCFTPTPTITPTFTPTLTPTFTPTVTIVADCTFNGGSASQTFNTPTPTPTLTPTITPTFTLTPTYTITPTFTPTPTPLLIRIDWFLGADSGGKLIVLDNLGNEVLNETTSAGSSRSGTLYLTNSQVPYTIRGGWASGSGNIIRYRVCDMIGGGEIFFSGPIDNMLGNVDYYANPTPIWVSVYLGANNNTPLLCPVE